MLHIKVLGIFLLLLALFFGPKESFADNINCYNLQNSATAAAACPYQDPTPVGSPPGTPPSYHILRATLCLVQYNITNAFGTIYINIVTALAPTIHIILIIYMALFGYAFLMGISGTQSKDFVTRIFKLCFVYALTNTTIQCDFFIYVFRFFITAMDQMAIFTAGPSAGLSSTDAGNSMVSGAFTYIDSIVNTQIQIVWKSSAIMIAFLLCGPGFFLSALMSCGFFFMFKAMITLFKTLGLSLIAITFCLMFAPVFFCLLLFEQTKKMFEGWLHVMISYIFQPMIIFFYFLIAADLLDISQVIKGLYDGGVVVPHNYIVDLLIFSFTIPSYGFNQGEIPCTICVQPVTYPLGFATMITIPPTAPPQSVFYTTALSTFQWTLMTIATSKFMDTVPDLATKLSTLGDMLYQPNLASTASGDIDSRTGQMTGNYGSSARGMIIPGFTGGTAGGGLAKRVLADPIMKTAGKIALGRRLFSAFNLVKPAEEVQADEELQNLRTEFRRKGIRPDNIEEVRDMMFRASENNGTTIEQIDEIEKMVKNSGSKSLKNSYEKYRKAYIERKTIALKEELRRAAISSRTTAEQMDEIGREVGKLGDEKLQETYDELREDFNYKKAKPIEEELNRAAADSTTTAEQMEAIRRKIAKSGSKKLMNKYEKLTKL